MHRYILYTHAVDSGALITLVLEKTFVMRPVKRQKLKAENRGGGGRETDKRRRRRKKQTSMLAKSSLHSAASISRTFMIFFAISTGCTTTLVDTDLSWGGWSRATFISSWVQSINNSHNSTVLTIVIIQ